jgi:hypothetical protein
MSEQLAFARVMHEADEAHRLMRDHHRAKVQAWFDRLPIDQKDELGFWMHDGPEWDTCAALSAAACDWYCTEKTNAI